MVPSPTGPTVHGLRRLRSALASHALIHTNGWCVLKPMIVYRASDLKLKDVQLNRGDSVQPMTYLVRHMPNDWGDLGPDDKRANNDAVNNGGRLAEHPMTLETTAPIRSRFYLSRGESRAAFTRLPEQPLLVDNSGAGHWMTPRARQIRPCCSLRRLPTMRLAGIVCTGLCSIASEWDRDRTCRDTESTRTLERKHDSSITAEEADTEGRHAGHPANIRGERHAL